MQADNRAEKAELQRVMWSPYPNHGLTLWAMPPRQTAGAKDHAHLEHSQEQRRRQRRQLQSWQISRNFSGSGSRGRTTEILATHRLNFGNQSILKLSIPASSIAFLGTLSELRMPQNKLTQLPPSLFMLTGLETLNLENNSLDERCTEDWRWRKLVHLRVLFLAGNRFRQLPPSLGHMRHLFYVDVSDNPLLTTLPIELLTAPSIGTLAANRCSLELAQSMANEDIDFTLPFSDLVSRGLHAQYTRVPPLSAMCIRQTLIATTIAINSDNPDESIGPFMPKDHTYNLDVCRRLLAAVDEVRRYPDDYRVLQNMFLNTDDILDDLCLCSVCGDPVMYSSFSFVKRAKGWELPIAWRCCSAACRDQAIQTRIQHKVPPSQQAAQI